MTFDVHFFILFMCIFTKEEVEMLIFTGMSFEEQLGIVVILSSFLMIYGIVYLLKQYKKGKN